MSRLSRHIKGPSHLTGPQRMTALEEVTDLTISVFHFLIVTYEIANRNIWHHKRKKPGEIDASALMWEFSQEHRLARDISSVHPTEELQGKADLGLKQ